MLKRSSLVLWSCVALFLAMAFALVYMGKHIFALFPLGLVAVYLALFHFDKLLLFMAFVTPLSLPLRSFMSVENDLSIPAEPLLFGLLLITVFKAFVSPKSFDRKLLRHPVTFAIAANLIWMFATSFSSTMPLVSFKYVVSRLWYLVAFYVLASHFFKDNRNIYKYFWIYTIAFLVVIGYAMARQSGYGFANKEAANFVVNPLLPDHTSYGAILAMLIPFAAVSFFSRRYAGFTKLAIAGIGCLLLLALVLSYTRAAWLGLGGAVGLLLLVIFRFRLRTIVLMAVLLITFLATFWTQILMSLERNRQDSSDNLTEQLYSMTNISTDASNLERINRWSCALRMFRERPVLGFGPGTYMFQYAPYQISSETTIISTNFGEVGNAHSEYLGPLSESGVLGSLTVLVIFLLTSVAAFRVHREACSREIRWLAMALFLGLFSYYLHGFLNNFLDIDKFSLLMWGYTAAIVVLDCYAPRRTAAASLVSSGGELPVDTICGNDSLQA